MTSTMEFLKVRVDPENPGTMANILAQIKTEELRDEFLGLLQWYTDDPQSLIASGVAQLPPQYHDSMFELFDLPEDLRARLQADPQQRSLIARDDYMRQLADAIGLSLDTPYSVATVSKVLTDFANKKDVVTAVERASYYDLEALMTEAGIDPASWSGNPGRYFKDYGYPTGACQQAYSLYSLARDYLSNLNG